MWHLFIFLSLSLRGGTNAQARFRGVDVGGGGGKGFDIWLKERDFPCFPFVYKTCPIWVVEPIRQQFQGPISDFRKGRGQTYYSAKIFKKLHETIGAPRRGNPGSASGFVSPPRSAIVLQSLPYVCLPLLGTPSLWHPRPVSLTHHLDHLEVI